MIFLSFLMSPTDQLTELEMGLTPDELRPSPRVQKHMRHGLRAISGHIQSKPCQLGK